MIIEIKILPAHKELYDKVGLPTYATEGSAAMDLYCTENVTLYPGEVKMISTGLAINMEDSTNTRPSLCALILPRSGLGHRGLVLGNTIGLIDTDYQGELKISAWNRNKDKTSGEYGDDHINLSVGDRFAQLMFVPVLKPSWQIVEEFSINTNRGSGGFGSTGD